MALAEQRLRAVGAVDIEPRPDEDHADPRARADARALARKANNAAREKAGDLHHGDAPLPARNHERVALVVLTGLIEVGIDESAGLVDDLLDPAGDRAAVHVTIEDAHEDRDALHRPP